jgi:hypothetical protein
MWPFGKAAGCYWEIPSDNPDALPRMSHSAGEVVGGSGIEYWCASLPPPGIPGPPKSTEIWLSSTGLDVKGQG